MSALVVAAAVVAGAAGAVARYVVAAAWAARVPGAPRDGVALVNAVGAWLLGVVTTGVADPSWRVVLAGGLLGGFTTFSTWIVNAVVARRVVRDLVLHLALGLPAALLGLVTGELLLAG